jgi:uncharacterized membrane protein YhaH (DUF805 family)
MEQLMQYETLSLNEAIRKSTNRIFQLTGRSRRSEYWWTIFVVSLIGLVATPLVGVVLNLLTIPLTFRRLHDTGRSGWWWGIRFVGYFIFICLFIGDIMVIFTEPSLEKLYSLLLKQAFWMIGFVVYHIVFIVILCLDGDQGINEYGESEKYFIEVTGGEEMK